MRNNPNQMKIKYILPIIAFVILCACSGVDQKVSFLGRENGYCIETTAWSAGINPELISYQLVYCNRKRNYFDNGSNILIWSTTKDVTDSIKDAQYRYAREALIKHQTAME